MAGKATRIRIRRTPASTKVKRIEVRERRIAITLYVDRPEAVRLAKEIREKWGE
jgi:hypothetical protein